MYFETSSIILIFISKKIKADIRAMWSMEYEIEQLQEDFAKQMGSIDIKTLTDDFIEEMLLQSKPLQGILAAIRGRQRVYRFSNRYHFIF